MKGKYEDMNKETILKATLGVHLFQGILDFYQLIEETEAKTIIYISKKCYALYLAFADLLDVDKDKLHCSDIMLPVIIDKIKNQKVILVDDILIHGRTLNEIYKYLESKGCHVEIRVLAKNDSCLKSPQAEGEESIADTSNLIELEDIVNKANCRYLCDDHEWKQISDLVMRCLWATNTPYCAYYPVVELSEEGTRHLKENKDKFAVRSCEILSTVRMGQNVSYYFLGGNNCGYFTMALLEHDKCGKTIWLPNILLSNGVLADWKRQKKLYSLIFSKKRKKVKELLNLQEDKVTREMQVYRAKFFVYVISYILMLQYLEVAGLSEDMYKINDINLRYSFGEKLDELFSEKNSLWTAKKSRAIYRLLLKKDKYTPADTVAELAPKHCRKNLYDELLKAVNFTKEVYKGYMQTPEKWCARILSRYYKKNNRMDDKQILYDKTRLSGIPVRKLIEEMVEHTKCHIQEVIAAYLTEFYLGYSSETYRYDGDEFGCYSHAGEQSYKCVVHEFVIPVYFAYRYKNFFDTKVAIKMEEFFVKATEKIYNAFGIPFLIEDYREYSRFENENIYDEYTIIEHCKESENKSGNKSASIMVDLGYCLEEFVCTTDELGEDSGEFEKMFMDYMQKLLTTEQMAGVKTAYTILESN